MKNNTIIKRFLIAGHLEGWSYLVLFFIAMPLKYFGNMPQYVTYAGLLHGIFVLLFVFFLWLMYTRVKLPLPYVLLAMLLSFLPFATFFLNKLVVQKSGVNS